MSEAPVQVFAHPPNVRSLALFGAVFSAVCAPLVLAVPWIAPDWNVRLLVAISLLVCVGSVAISLMMLRSADDTFVVSPEGLRWTSPRRADVFLPWQDVEDVHPENVMQRLVVADRGATRTILIEFHLRGFGELRRIVLERTRRNGR